MRTLKETLEEYRSEGKAVGHFNVANMEMLRAVVGAAKNTGLPVIVGVSEGERDAFGVKEIVALVKTIREESGLEIYLNADHTYSIERAKEAIDAGFDSVIFDGAKLSFDENVSKTKEVAEYANGKDVLVEGEYGYIGSGSTVIEKLPEGAAVTEESMTSPEIAKKFVYDTSVDLFAPAVGNIHGVVKGTGNPKLDIERIENIAKETGVPLVLHGGSGVTDDDFVSAVKAGITVIHVSTELRLAYRKALQLSLQEDPEQLAPYKYLKPAISAVQEVVENRLKLFSGK